MLKKLLPFLLLTGLMATAQPFVTVSTSQTPEQLVNEVLLGSGCVIGTNVTATSACGIGYFNANDSDFPFNEGVVLRSGNVSLMGGPYSAASLNSVCSNMTDQNLQSLAGGSNTIQDASSLQFQFTALGSNISFDFIYASNEYGQFQCSFTDYMGIFITDINTGVSSNLAVVPNTNLPVKSTTIRDGAYSPQCSSLNVEYFGEYYVNNPTTAAINMNGRTVPLNASSEVTPGHVYSIKFVVGDANDTQSDSAIFIKASSSPAGDCMNALKLVAFLDNNNDGVKDESEPLFTHGVFTAGTDNTEDIAQYSSSYGTIFIPALDAASLNLGYTFAPEFAAYFTATASYNDVSYNPAGGNTYYFPVTLLQAYEEVGVNLIPASVPRPGFTYNNLIEVRNNGLNPLSGTVTFTKDPSVSITTTTEPGVVMTTDGFTYDFSNLQPAETKNILVSMQVPVIPQVNLGDILHTSVALSNTSLDVDSTNNMSELAQTVVGSYDPNDKSEAHGETIDFAGFGSEDYLYYTIRFENTGTADAIDISVEDLLDVQLDEQSLRTVAASADYQLEQEGSKLKWTFSDINLPPGSVDEVGSHGFVTFKIKPKAGYAIGDIIPNTASIFFDTNPAIVTNTVNTEFTAPLGTPTFEKQITVYPNPAKNILNVQLTDSMETLQSVVLYDLSGRKVKESKPDAATVSLQVSDLAKGVYLLEIQSENQKAVQKIIVE